MRVHPSATYCLKWIRQRPATFALHVALLLIAIGACVTHFVGEQGEVTVSHSNHDIRTAHNKEGGEIELPFSLQLISTTVDYYPATTAPRNYSCKVRIRKQSGDAACAEVSMKNVLNVENYRFTLLSISEDSAILSVNHDPWGIGISYAGYFLLLTSMTLFLILPNTGFRRLLRLIRNKIAITVLLACAMTNAASGEVISRDVAETFGKIHVYCDQRLAPMETLTRGVLLQVYGKERYKDESSEQVALGLMSDFERWKNEPVIRVNSGKVRNILGIDGNYARLTDFFDAKGYKLQPYLLGREKDEGIRQADENVSLLTALATGRLMRIIPCESGTGGMEWFSLTDDRPPLMDAEEWNRTAELVSEIYRHASKGEDGVAISALVEIMSYQEKKCEDAGTPLSKTAFQAEICYNRLGNPLAVGIILIAAGIGGAVFYRRKRLLTTTAVVMAAAQMWLTLRIALRWIIVHHMPLGNGEESMEVMAWLSAFAGLVLAPRFREVSYVGAVVAGMALSVAAMSGSGTIILPLMPVLNNPLLSLHVLVIMLAYALFAIQAAISVVVLAKGRKAGSMVTDNRLSAISLAMLYPAELLLSAGIIIGAIWANDSWGRYWGWDPKETWALTTLLVYSVALHWQRIKWLQRSRNMAIYLACGFVCVLITYFGVNYFMGGLHSYAG